MRSQSLPAVLLAKAVEEADPLHVLMPFADREHVTREVLRASGLSTTDFEGTALGRRAARALSDRSDRLVAVLARRYPVVPELLERVRWPAWLSVLLLIAAFASGVVLSALDVNRRINILAFPFLGVIAWNLVIYAVLILAWLRRSVGLTGAAVPPATGRGLAAAVTRIVARPLRALARRTVRVDAALGRAVEGFVSDWTRHAAPIVGSRARRLLHLGSATLALGLVAGLYFRGIVFRYEAGWESTFLGPSQVQDVLRIVFGPASRWSGVALPGTIESVAALRWDGHAGGGDAAPWIHLIAVTLGLYVVLPRLALALAAWLSEIRMALTGGVPPQLTGYARRAFGAVGRGLRSALVSVAPYAYEPPAGTLSALEALLVTRLGATVRLAVQPLLHYGEEAAAAHTFLAPGGATIDAQVLLFSLGATPENENHGLVVAAARDAVQHARPMPELLIVVDEAPYAARLGSDASLAARLEERRQLWRRFLAGYGLEATMLDAGRAA